MQTVLEAIEADIFVLENTYGLLRTNAWIQGDEVNYVADKGQAFCTVGALKTAYHAAEHKNPHINLLRVAQRLRAETGLFHKAFGFLQRLNPYVDATDVILEPIIVFNDIPGRRKKHVLWLCERALTTARKEHAELLAQRQQEDLRRAVDEAFQHKTPTDVPAHVG